MKQLNFIKSFISKIIKSYTINKYNEFTIAEYFRQQGAQIGNDCFIATKTLGTEPYLVKIGNHVAIATGARFHTHDGATWVFRKELPDLRLFGPIVVKDNCIIGDHAYILPNVTIGPNAIVGAASVVISDVPPDTIVMGNPARPVGSVLKYKEKCLEKWKLQKPQGFHPESLKHYGSIENPEMILKQLRDHLTEVFKDILQ